MAFNAREQPKRPQIDIKIKSPSNGKEKPVQRYRIGSLLRPASGT
jgi:hypothetical protein